MDPEALELEHVIGSQRIVICNGEIESQYVSSIGSSVMLADIHDPHKQVFLYGHDSPITALDISASNSKIASGAMQSPSDPKGNALVIVWDYQSQQPIHYLIGIFGAISHVKFSPDEKLLAAAGSDNTVSIWDVESGEQIYCRKHGFEGTNDVITFLVWGAMTASASSIKPSYTLAFSVLDKIHFGLLEYDYRVMRYVLSTNLVQYPSGGFIRSYSAALIDPTGNFLLAGTTTGEVVIFNIVDNTQHQNMERQVPRNVVFRTALLVARNGIRTITFDKRSSGPNGRLCFCIGGGDGYLRLLRVWDMDWIVDSSVGAGPHAVCSVSQSASGNYFLVSTQGGSLFCVALNGDDTRLSLIESSHTGPVFSSALVASSSESYISIGSDGFLLMRNLNDYSILWRAQTPPEITPMCVCALASFNAPGNGPNARLGIPCDIYTGMSDGSLQMYTVSTPVNTVLDSEGNFVNDGGQNVPIWKTIAHRNGVTCMSGNRAVVVTGGGDGRVNIWSRASRDLIISFSDHSRPLMSVFFDYKYPELLYSASSDRVLNQYNLRSERRVRQYIFPPMHSQSCTITSVVQLRHAGSERELVVGTNDGRIFLFDPDIEKSVGTVDLLQLLLDWQKNNPQDPLTMFIPVFESNSSRPVFRVTGLSVSSSGRWLAVSVSCGVVLVLSIPQEDIEAQTRVVDGKLSGRNIVSHQTRDSRSIVSPAVRMQLLSAFSRGTFYTSIQWAPDEKQLIVTSQDSSVSLFNWYLA